MLSYDVSLNKKTSFQCDTHASAVFCPETTDDLCRFLQETSQRGFVYGVDFHVLGKGSNLLFEDGGYTGCLIDLSKFNEIRTVEKTDKWVLHAQAGVGMGMLLQMLRKEAYTGFEFVFGIPGSIGGGIRMNAGTPDGWFANVLCNVSGCNLSGETFEKNVSESDFQYRDFPFSHDKIITGGTFIFEKSTLEIVESKISAAKQKRDRQPLTYPNFGSVFKNPKPQFAGALIEEVGLKGYQVGQAQISEKHANFMINHGKAKVRDVKKLIAIAIEKVRDKTGISLETEVHILGEE